MALKIEEKLSKSIVVKDAYHRIDAFRFDQPSRIYLQVGVYDGEPLAGDEALKKHEFHLSIEEVSGKDGINMAECYSYLKSTDKYKEAVDV